MQTSEGEILKGFEINIEIFKKFIDPSIELNALDYFRSRSHILVKPFIEIPLRCSA